MPRVAHPPLSLRQVFAKNIRLVRIAQGMSQERMADEAQIDRAFVGTLERGQRNISIDKIEQLANAVATPAHELLNPNLAKERGLDETIQRVPRSLRPHPITRR